MGKLYRCVKTTCPALFTEGSIYELNSENRVRANNGFLFTKGQFSSSIEWLEHTWGYKFEEVKEMFTMNDLKNGMLVELRNGDRCIVLRNNECENAISDILVSIKNKTAYAIEHYDLYGKTNDYEQGDIMRVVNPFCYPDIVDTDYEFSRLDHVIFDRSKVEERKRMTVEDIEKELGYKVAIVEEEGK